MVLERQESLEDEKMLGTGWIYRPINHPEKLSAGLMETKNFMGYYFSLIHHMTI